jgi:hypothetical protein
VFDGDKAQQEAQRKHWLSEEMQEARRHWNSIAFKQWLQGPGGTIKTPMTASLWAKWFKEATYREAVQLLREFGEYQRATAAGPSSAPAPGPDQALDKVEAQVVEHGFGGMSTGEFQLLRGLGATRDQDPAAATMAQRFDRILDRHRKAVAARMALPVFGWEFRDDRGRAEDAQFRYRFADAREASTLTPNLAKYREQFPEIFAEWTAVIEAYRGSTPQITHTKKKGQGPGITRRIDVRQKVADKANRHFQGYTQTSPFVSLVSDLDKLKALAASEDKVIQSIVRSTRNLVPSADYDEFPGRAGGKARAPHVLKFAIPDPSRFLLSPEEVEDVVNAGLRTGEERTGYPTMKAVGERLFLGLDLDAFLWAFAENPY